MHPLDLERRATFINAFLWLGLLVFTITMKLTVLVFVMLLIFFITTLVHRLLKKIGLPYKLLSALLALSVFSALGYLIYASFSFLIKDTMLFFQESEAVIIQTLQRFNLASQMIQSINDLYRFVGDYIKENLTLLTQMGVSILYVILGAVFGLILFFTKPQEVALQSLWEHVERKIYASASLIAFHFGQIMGTQVIISLLNTLSISILAFGITYLYSGMFLPYWYIIIPLVALFSMIPVVGNVIVNILIAVAALKISVVYLFIVIGYFFVVHKLELLIIGKVLHQKAHVPFVFILFSMLIGQMLFASSLGIIMGMVLLFIGVSVLKSYPPKPLS